MQPIPDLYRRRAALLRQLAALDEQLAVASESGPARGENAVLSLSEAAAYMGEPVSTFRRRLEYAKARVSRPGERRRRYLQLELDRIRRDRLDANRIEY